MFNLKQKTVIIQLICIILCTFYSLILQKYILDIRHNIIKAHFRVAIKLQSTKMFFYEFHRILE